jgi:hypothetical protein
MRKVVGAEIMFVLDESAVDEPTTCGWRIVNSCMIPRDSPSCYDSAMRNLVVLFIHFIATLARLLGPGGVRSLVAESLLLKHQLLILKRSRKRSPNLPSSDRILAGLLALLVRPTRLLRSAIVLKPSTLLALHKSMSKGKYRMLFSPDRRRQPGPKGPSAELIRAVVEMKQRNPNWGCPRIAQQMALAFHIQIDKDVVRRILARHYRPGQDSDGPSWLTFLGHMKDSVWSMDLFRCESATLRTHWSVLPRFRNSSFRFYQPRFSIISGLCPAIFLVDACGLACSGFLPNILCFCPFAEPHASN